MRALESILAAVAAVARSLYFAAFRAMPRARSVVADATPRAEAAPLGALDAHAAAPPLGPKTVHGALMLLDRAWAVHRAHR